MQPTERPSGYCINCGKEAVRRSPAEKAILASAKMPEDLLNPLLCNKECLPAPAILQHATPKRGR